MIMIVKRDGRIQEYSKDKLIKILNVHMCLTPAKP